MINICKIRKPLLSSLALLLLIVGIVLFANYYPDIPVEELKEKYGQAPSQFLEVNGMQVHYRDEGEGPVLLLLHGTAASLHTWDGWLERMKDDFRIIRLDLPAFGLTGPNLKGDYSTNAYVDFLDAFINKLGVSSFHLVGNSLGGNIAWNYAATHPTKVKKLILIAPSGLPIPDGKRPMAFRLASNSSMRWMVRHVTPKGLIRKSLEEVYVDDSKIDDQLVNRYHDMLCRAGNRMAFIDRVQQIQIEDTSRLAKIKSPVLLQWGEKDVWLPVSLAPRFAALLPNSKTIIYPTLGHVPMEEDPAVTARDVRAFLSEPIIDLGTEKPVLLKR